ncbi:hypothetical protein LXL04_038680 [Taraxacum kok-saghyz]
MATNQTNFCVPIPEDQCDHPTQFQAMSTEEDIDYSQRGQWLRAAVLGANDGLVSVASLMMGVGAVKHDSKAMILSGFAGLVAGACSMAIGEFVSVYSQLDVEVAQMKRDGNHEKKEKEELPNPMQAAVASALAFTLGAIVPLLAASFIEDHKLRLGMVVAAVSFALVLFGWASSILGGTPVFKSCFRVLLGGVMAMGITFGLTKLIGSSDTFIVRDIVPLEIQSNKKPTTRNQTHNTRSDWKSIETRKSLPVVDFLQWIDQGQWTEGGTEATREESEGIDDR